MAATPTNAGIAQRLREIRVLMEFAGEPFFKFMAYERAAEAVENAAPIADLAAAGTLTELPGVGATIAGRIAELCAIGTCGYLEELRARYPATLLEVLAVPGLGMKTAQMLFDRVGIASLAGLEEALRSGALDGLPRLGKKSIENLRRGVLVAKGRRRRTPLGRAQPVATAILAMLAERTDAADLTTAGSVRRHEATVGDIDLVCTSDDPFRVIAAFTGWEAASAVVADGVTKASIWMADGLQIDLRVLPAPVYGNLLQHFTGSREHNIQLRESAVRMGLRVSENGIVRASDGRVVTCRTEAEVYGALGLAEIPPEMRVGLGEIEAARSGTLPAVVALGDLRGDFHMHCDWSDGADTLEEMISACAARGYEYHAISDHSWGRGGGLEPSELRAQRALTRLLGDRHGIRTLCAAEVDILADGTLAYEDAVLAELDVVIASVHDHTGMSREAMTRRIIRACENPYVTIIGHPTGRNVETFPGYEIDLDAVCAAAARTGTALEIDGHPNRLDLPGALVRRARDFGVTFACDSDAHAAAALGNTAYAVGQARRGWVTADAVLNARPLAGVLAFVESKRAKVRHAAPADP